MAFLGRGDLEKAWFGDAVVALRGSWGTAPSGSWVGDPATRREPKLVLVRFEEGKARRVDDLLTGFQLPDGSRWARPVGVAAGPDGALYFTNDQVMDVFDLCARRPSILGLERSYVWPSFPVRKPSGTYESADHREILDTGYLYNKKRAHIGRILAVLFNNRPTIDGRLLPVVHSVHETGTLLREFRLYQPERVVDSPARVYFGERLREAGVGAGELRDLLPNGKIDRKTLLTLKPSVDQTAVNLSLRTDNVEQVITGIWEKILNRADIDKEQSFFDLGGDSLKVMQMVTMIDESLKIEVPAVKLFEFPSIKLLSWYLQKTKLVHQNHISHKERAQRRRNAIVKRRLKAA